MDINEDKHVLLKYRSWQLLWNHWKYIMKFDVLSVENIFQMIIIFQKLE